MANTIEMKLNVQNSSLCVIIAAELSVRDVPLTQSVTLGH